MIASNSDSWTLKLDAVFRAASGVLALVLCATFVAPPAASAQDAYTCIDDMEEAEVDYRINFIQESFRKHRRKSSAWRFGWMAGLAGVGAYLFYTGATGERTIQDGNPKWRRFYDYALAAQSAFTVLKLAAVPMPDVWGHKRIRKMPASTLEEKRAKLEYATKTLEKSAVMQDQLIGTGNYGGAMLSGLVFGTVYTAKWRNQYGSKAVQPDRSDRVLDRFRSAGLFLIPTGVAVGLGVTGPSHSIADWEKYRGIACSSRYYDKGESDIDLDLSVSPLNVQFTLTF